MKKIRRLTTFMAATACVAPSFSILSSCGNSNLSELVSEIKNDTIQTFLSMCKNVHRNIWDEQEAFDFIITTMQGLGYKDYAGRDYWSYVPEVREIIAEKTHKTVWNFPNYGNIWYDIEATPGCKNPGIILQTHMDSQMNFGVDDAGKKSWEDNGVNATFDRDNDIISTDGQTSLGADGGLGMAALLTLAKYADKFTHGPIRLLFTAGESEATKTYAAGAQFLTNDQNLNGKETSESEQSYLEIGSELPFGKAGQFAGIISLSGLYNKTIYSSVGGISEINFNDSELSLKNEDTTYPTKVNKISSDSKVYNLTIENLHGGKSSKDINSGYASALELLMATMYGISLFDTSIQLIEASSQPGPYNIATTASCKFTSKLEPYKFEYIKESVFTEFSKRFKGENWNEVSGTFKEITNDYTYALSIEQTINLIKLFFQELDVKDRLPWGPTNFFDPETEKSVKTSYNHGKLSLSVDQNGADSSSLQFFLVCRSNDKQTLESWRTASSKSLLEEWLVCLYPKAENPQIEVTNHTFEIFNPVWEGNKSDTLINLITEGYNKINIKPNVTKNHGWVEVGCFQDAYEATSPDMQMAVLGMDINNSQELSETVYTDSLNTLFKALIYTLQNSNKIQ